MKVEYETRFCDIVIHFSCVFLNPLKISETKRHIYCIILMAYHRCKYFLLESSLRAKIATAGRQPAAEVVISPFALIVINTAVV